MNLKQDALELLTVALMAVNPKRLLPALITRDANHLRIKNIEITLEDDTNLYVIGFGKASGTMAEAIENILADRITGGIVIVPDNYTGKTVKICQREAGHPFPDERGLKATEEILQLLSQAQDSDLVICLISGGGSALLEKLPSTITLEMLREVTEIMLNSGATIEEVNTIRKNLSLVKGGKLATYIHPARCLSLILSDVIDDPLDVIASGPTAPDSTTLNDVREILKRYQLDTRFPEPVLTVLEKGLAGTPLQPDDPVFEKVSNIIVGNNLLALRAAEVKARQKGYQPMILGNRICGESREVARVIAEVMKEIVESEFPIQPPACVIFGGETTVTVEGSGLGGRNQELVLAALIELKEVDFPFVLLSCGSDGRDGPTDAAGAIITEKSWENALLAGLNPQSYLQNNDAYHFFERIDGLIKTGPTGTNVMDIGIVLLP
ncbi:MAG: glycerate kinase [Calditrichaeota bacterium]|nr:MAG: glycerate kinase [Calditrichota bacterium]